MRLARRSLSQCGYGSGLKFHGAAKAFDVHAEPAEGVEGGEAAVRVEGDDVSEGAAEGEFLGRFAEGVNEGIVPRAAVADVVRDGLELGVGLLTGLIVWLAGRLRPQTEASRRRTWRRPRLPW